MICPLDRKEDVMENIEITLEQIELVKDRTGVSYKEAKEALEMANGSVVDAIISIEEQIDGAEEAKESNVEAIVAKIKEAVRKGNVSKISVLRNGDVMLNIPVNIGIIGTVLFPWAGIAAAIAAFGTKCEVQLVKDDGEIISISEKVDKGIDTVVTKGGVIIDEVTDKGSEIWDSAKTKGEDLINTAMEKMGKAPIYNNKEEGCPFKDDSEECKVCEKNCLK